MEKKRGAQRTYKNDNNTMLDGFGCAKWWGFLTLAVILTLIVGSKWGISAKGRRNPSRAAGVGDQGMKRVAEQARKYQFMAEQDQNPIMAMIHAVVARCKLQTLAMFVPTSEALDAFDIDVLEMQRKNQKLQEQLIAEINASSPKLCLPKDLSVVWSEGFF